MSQPNHQNSLNCNSNQHPQFLIKYIHFHQQFDVLKLQQEVAGLETALWTAHYNSSNYEGRWTTLQLRSVNGEAANNTAIDAASLAAGISFKDTALLALCPYIKDVIDFFKIEKTAVRLMKLDAGAVIKPHRDHGLNFEQGELRLHVPVSTNENVRFFLEDEQLPMQEGSCWYLNLSLTHSVINESDSNRVHLVIDGLVNDWIKDFFSRHEHYTVLCDEAQSHDPHSPEDKRNVIYALRQLHTEVADQLADEMEASMQSSTI